MLLLFISPGAHAQDNPILVQGWYLEDREGSLSRDEALASLRKSDTETLDTLRFNLGNRDSRFWLYFTLLNTGEETLELMLDTGVPYRAGLKVEQLNSHTSTLLDTSERSVFSDRGDDDLILHTRAFTLAPGQHTALLLEYTTRGSTYMPMTLRTGEAFASRMQQGALWSAFFYAASLVLLVVFLLLGLGLRNRFVLMYTGLFAIGLLFIASTEGFAFKYLWPNAPNWNQYASLVLLFLSTGTGFMIALVAAEPGSLPRWSRWLIGALGTLSFSLSILCVLLPFSALVELGVLLMLLAFLTHFVVVLSWLQGAIKRNLVTLVSTLLVVPITVVLMLLGLAGFDLPDVAFSHAMRITYFFTATMTLASLATHITALRMDHEKSLAQALKAAERDAELSRAVIRSENRYHKARELAASRQRQLATTSHDIRQPLTALRAVVDQLPQDMGERERSILTRSLDYIEGISRSHIAETPSPADPEISPIEEIYRADLLLHTVKRMFQGEADSHEISLRVAPCSALVNQPPLVLMRILSNLTSNAIKHSGGGAVLLGCRRRIDGLAFEVIDNGPGMEAAELERVKQPYEKGAHSEGEGLGLAICWQLAADNGFELLVASQTGKGTRFSLKVPTENTGSHSPRVASTS